MSTTGGASNCQRGVGGGFRLRTALERIKLGTCMAFGRAGKVMGKNMNLHAVTSPDVRLVLDLGPPCVKTRESDFYCLWRNRGRVLLCS